MPGMPENIWFKQQKEVPSASPQESASKMPPWYGSHVEFCNRAGGPGAGRTEVVVAATDKALRNGCKVLIAGPLDYLSACSAQNSRLIQI